MSNDIALIPALTALPAIALSELQTDAAFLTRRDRKYLLPESRLNDVLRRIDPRTRVLEIDGRRDFGYLTPYFDDDAMTAYHRAARGRSDRFKLRTRLYTESGICQLEVKIRDSRGLTVKHRRDHSAQMLESIEEGERRWLGEFQQLDGLCGRVRHHMTTDYRRSTLVLPGNLARVTIDRELRFVSSDGRTLHLPGMAIVETKGAGAPTEVDRILWALGIRPTPMSKFAAGMSLLNPALPTNRWHRVHQRLAQAASQAALTGGGDPGR